LDELIGLALKSLAEKRAASQQQLPGESAGERYARILEELRARSAQPPVDQTLAPVSQPPQPPRPPNIVLSGAEGPPLAAPPSPAPARKHGPLDGLFEGGNSLVRAVVAAELLDRPLALRENAYWQKR